MFVSRLYKLFTLSTVIDKANLYLKICNAISKEKALHKFPEFAKEIELFISQDPSSSKKYLEWQLNILKSQPALAPEIADVTNLFHKYHPFLENKELNSYQPQDFTELSEKLQTIKEEREAKKQKRKTYNIDPAKVACGHKIVYTSPGENPKYEVLLITNKDASMHFGKDSRWCIRRGDKSFFEDYDANNVVFFFIFNKHLPKTDKFAQIALSYQRDAQNNILELQCWDAFDTQMVAADVEQELDDNEIHSIINLTESIAQAQPKSLLAKIDSGEVPEEELYKLYLKENNPETKTHLLGALMLQSKNPDLLRKLYNETEEHYYLLSNKYLPLDLVEDGLGDEDYNARQVALENPNITMELLLRNMDKPEIKSVISNRTDAPLPVIYELAKERKYWTNLINNPITPSEILVLISNDGHFSASDGVQSAVLEHPNLTLELAYKFIDRGNALKRIEDLAGKNYTLFVGDLKNYRLPIYKAEKMLMSNTLDDVEKHYLRKYIASKSANETILSELLALKDSDFITKEDKSNLRLAMCHNKYLPLTILEALAYDKDINPGNIALNPNITTDIIKILLDREDFSPSTFATLVANQKLSPDALRLVANQWLQYNDDDFKDILHMIAIHPNTPADVLKKLIQSNMSDPAKEYAQNRIIK